MSNDQSSEPGGAEHQGQGGDYEIKDGQRVRVAEPTTPVSAVAPVVPVPAAPADADVSAAT